MKTHGSLDLVPLARNFTDRISPWTRQSAFLGTVEPKLCLRGDAEAVGTCNKHTCPGERGREFWIHAATNFCDGPGRHINVEQ